VPFFRLFPHERKESAPGGMDKPPNPAGATRAARRPGRDEDTGGTVKTVPYGDGGTRDARADTIRPYGAVNRCGGKSRNGQDRSLRSGESAGRECRARSESAGT